MNFDEFYELTKSANLDMVVNSYLLQGPVFYFKGDYRRYFDFKNRISAKLNVHPNNIEVVGSAKLGFRLKMEKIGESFGADSDIDVVVVSNDLFEEVWSQLILKKNNAWYNLSPKERANLKDCQKNLYWGYIRPDRLPTTAPFSKWWWGIFEQLSNCSDYDRRKIRGRLFKSWHHVQMNYCYAIERLMEEYHRLTMER
jgi:hypothetical protein